MRPISRYTNIEFCYIFPEHYVITENGVIISNVFVRFRCLLPKQLDFFYMILSLAFVIDSLLMYLPVPSGHLVIK